MRSETDGTPAPTSQSRLVGFAWAAVAVVLIALAAPRLASDVMALPAGPVLRDLQEQKPVTVDDLESLIETQQKVVALSGNGRYWTDLGLAELLLAERTGGDQTGPDAPLRKAIDALRQGLAVAPGNPYAWARLAYAEALADGWTPRAIDALRLAHLTAPYEARLIWSRLRLGLLAWNYLDNDDRDLVFQQVRQAGKQDTAMLARLAAELNRVAVARAALLRTPETAQAFEDQLQKLN